MDGQNLTPTFTEYDGMRGVDLEYNSLNLIEKVSQGNTANATYRWLADGTKAGVTDNEGNGFEYLGSFVYQRDVAGLNLESTSFGGGRFVASSTGELTPYYHITDHLGSVRAVFTAEFKDVSLGRGTVRRLTTELIAQNDYYPFGLKHENPNLANHTSNRYLYNGKEEQTTGNVDLLDYGARMYDATLGIWRGVDILAEKHMGVSPFAFSNNNPIRFVDPDGRDWYSYLDKESGATKYKYTTEHRSQQDLNKAGIRGTYMGITAYTQDKSQYLSLMGNRFNTHTAEGKPNVIAELARNLDESIINYYATDSGATEMDLSFDVTSQMARYGDNIFIFKYGEGVVRYQASDNTYPWYFEWGKGEVKRLGGYTYRINLVNEDGTAASAKVGQGNNTLLHWMFKDTSIWQRTKTKIENLLFYNRKW